MRNELDWLMQNAHSATMLDIGKTMCAYCFPVVMLWLWFRAALAIVVYGVIVAEHASSRATFSYPHILLYGMWL